MLPDVENTLKKHLGLALIGSLTLGLAPFFPEPHLVKQAMNLANGNPMTFMDWVDIPLHGAPWVLLILALGDLARTSLKAKQEHP